MNVYEQFDPKLGHVRQQQTFYQLSVSGDHKFGEGLWLVVLAQGLSWSYSPWELEHLGAV